MSKKNSKVEVRKSGILGTGLGQGLFAIVDIKKNAVIAEFKGRLRKANQNVRNSRSNIHFADDSVLECPDSDLASFANDGIFICEDRRQLLRALKSEEPFYKKSPGATINAEIKINNKLHRAFLMACRDIKTGDEIFVHYGFDYWFKNEFQGGFLYEEEIEQNGFPKNFYEYPGFRAYLNSFYDVKKMQIKPYKDSFDIILTVADDYFVLMPIPNYEKMMEKIWVDDLLT